MPGPGGPELKHAPVTAAKKRERHPGGSLPSGPSSVTPCGADLHRKPRVYPPNAAPPCDPPAPPRPAQGSAAWPPVLRLRWAALWALPGRRRSTSPPRSPRPCCAATPDEASSVASRRPRAWAWPAWPPRRPGCARRPCSTTAAAPRRPRPAERGHRRARAHAQTPHRTTRVQRPIWTPRPEHTAHPLRRALRGPLSIDLHTPEEAREASAPLAQAPLQRARRLAPILARLCAKTGLSPPAHLAPSPPPHTLRRPLASSACMSSEPPRQQTQI